MPLRFNGPVWAFRRALMRIANGPAGSIGDTAAASRAQRKLDEEMVRALRRPTHGTPTGDAA